MKGWILRTFGTRFKKREPPIDSIRSENQSDSYRAQTGKIYLDIYMENIESPVSQHPLCDSYWSDRQERLYKRIIKKRINAISKTRNRVNIQDPRQFSGLSLNVRNIVDESVEEFENALDRHTSLWAATTNSFSDQRNNGGIMTPDRSEGVERSP